MSKENKNQEQKKSPGHIVGTVIGIILCIVFSAIIVVNGILIVKSFQNDNKVPSIGGKTPLIVMSGSMEPTIMTGDLIIVQDVDVNQLKKGDIIAFYGTEQGSVKAVTHRIVDVKDHGNFLSFQTKGDANNSVDKERVNSPAVIGIYQTRIPMLGSISMFMQTVPGIIICIGAPLLIFLMYEIIRRRKFDKKKQEESDALLEELRQLKAQQASQISNGNESK